MVLDVFVCLFVFLIVNSLGNVIPIDNRVLKICLSTGIFLCTLVSVSWYGLHVLSVWEFTPFFRVGLFSFIFLFSIIEDVYFLSVVFLSP